MSFPGWQHFTDVVNHTLLGDLSASCVTPLDDPIESLPLAFPELYSMSLSSLLVLLCILSL